MLPQVPPPIPLPHESENIYNPFRVDFWFPKCVDWSFYVSHADLFPQWSDLYIVLLVAAFFSVIRLVLEKSIFCWLGKRFIPYFQQPPLSSLAAHYLNDEFKQSNELTRTRLQSLCETTGLHPKCVLLFFQRKGHEQFIQSTPPHKLKQIAKAFDAQPCRDFHRFKQSLFSVHNMPKDTCVSYMWYREQKLQRKQQAALRKWTETCWRFCAYGMLTVMEWRVAYGQVHLFVAFALFLLL